MHRTQVFLDDWQYQNLRSAAEREGRSISNLVREAISAYLKIGESAKAKAKATESAAPTTLCLYRLGYNVARQVGETLRNGEIVELVKLGHLSFSSSNESRERVKS